MKQYRLTQKQIEFIGEIQNKGFSDTFKEEFQKSRNDNVINLDGSDAEDVLDVLSNLLCDVGLNEDDEPNSMGLKIEGLIDVFSVKS